MAISTTIINFAPLINTRYGGDIQTAWQTVVDAGGPALLDGAPVVNPPTQITRSTTHIFKRNGIGNTLLIRLGYSNGLTAITNPQVHVFGRHSSADFWMSLNAFGGTFPNALITDLTKDVDDATYKYTSNDGGNLMWKIMGCEEFIIGIEAVLAGTGTVNNSFLQAKFSNNY